MCYRCRGSMNTWGSGLCHGFPWRCTWRANSGTKSLLDLETSGLDVCGSELGNRKVCLGLLQSWALAFPPLDSRASRECPEGQRAAAVCHGCSAKHLEPHASVWIAHVHSLASPSHARLRVRSSKAPSKDKVTRGGSRWSSLQALTRKDSILCKGGRGGLEPT